MEQYLTSDTEVLGVVFDVSLRQEDDGRRVIDNVKSGLSDFVRRNLEDDDIMYLYHPDIIDTVNRVGAQVAMISNYSTDGWKFDLNLALRQTLFVIASEPHDTKTLLLITDRLADPKVLYKLASINEKDMLDCRLVCLDIGNHLSDSTDESVKIVHVPSSQQLGSFKEIIHGEDNCCSANCTAE